MRLGTRWSLGAPPAAGLPAAVVEAVSRVEAEVAVWAAAEPGRDASGWHWTLTWLEGSPVVELDDGTVIRYDRGTDAAEVVEAP